MSDYPQQDYAERKCPPLPKRLEKKVIAAGNHCREFGVLSHRFDFPYWADIDDSELRADSYIEGNPGFDFETIYSRIDGDVASDTTTNQAAKMTAAMLKMMSDWIIDVDPSTGEKALKDIGRRVVAIHANQLPVKVLRLYFGRNWRQRVGKLRADFWETMNRGAKSPPDESKTALRLTPESGEPEAQQILQESGNIQGRLV